MNDLLQWIVGGGLATLLTIWGTIRVDRWRHQREAKSDEQSRYDGLWAKLEKLQNDVESERDEYRRKWADSEQQRQHEGEVCEKRVREARRESAAECDQIRDQMRGLSTINFQLRLELDATKGQVSMLTAKMAAGVAIVGGRRTTDPALGEAGTIIPGQP